MPIRNQHPDYEILGVSHPIEPSGIVIGAMDNPAWTQARGRADHQARPGQSFADGCSGTTERLFSNQQT